MIFLIEYDRRLGRLIKFEIFNDLQKSEAQNLRLERELALNSNDVDHEVVLLEAPSEESVRRTHRRYFEDLKEILRLAKPAS